jgi:Asp-tRNA(Asn)/Glu-tRNA(Gln) amidotransferase A subunit family amidase
MSDHDEAGRERPASEAVRRSLARILAREETIHAWAEVDTEGAQAQAREIDSAPSRLPLAGLTLGVKDIIDVGGLRCEFGSPIYRGRLAFSDAALVATLKSLGIVVVGKAVTTEFAFLNPPHTRNPHNFAYSAGGSSSGSAAAVADGHVDAALGTQTAGSILRPASFCGVVGYKPTFGRFSRAGVLSTSPSLDTVGWLSKDMDTTIRVHDALGGEPLGNAQARFGFFHGVHAMTAEPAMRLGIERLAESLKATEVPSPPMLLDNLHATVMRYELRQELATEFLQHRDQLSPLLKLYLEDSPIQRADYLGALEHRDRFDIERMFAGADVLLTPAAPGEAVEYGTTGDPCFNRLATLLGLPAISLPFGRGPKGLPLGVQLIARRNQDDVLLATARRLDLHLRTLTIDPTR